MSSKNRNSANSKQIVTPPKQPSAKIVTETHKCTGKFKEDFENICNAKAFKYIPEIIHRSKRPGSSGPHQTQPDTTKVEKAPKGGKGAKQVVEKEVPNGQNGENEGDLGGDNAEAPPKTYVLKDSYEYFKQKIHVEMDNPEKLDTVTEIYIKGWKLERPILEVLQLCLPHVDRLHTLNLWNCGLDEESIRAISSLLGNCQNLKSLILDSNPVSTPVYQVLLFEENSSVQNLSLRNNQIDDEAATALSFGLGDIKRQNSKLLSLNLNNNFIGDKGAIAIARALRTNRTLLTLSLGNNNIGDNGAKAFADVISKFPLNHEEIVHRRKVISGRNWDKSPSPPSRRGNDSKERPTSQKSLPQTTVSETKGGKKEKSAKKETPSVGGTTGGGANAPGAQKTPKDTQGKTKKDDKTVRKDKASIDLKTSKAQKTNAKQSAKRSAKENEEVNHALLEISALTDMAENVNDELWLYGNRNLINLNLSKNELTEKAVEHFIIGLQYQKVILEMHKGQGLGLLRLVLAYNKMNNENEKYQKLLEILKLKDPFYKPPIDNDALDRVSVHSKDGKESSLAKHVKPEKKH